MDVSKIKLVERVCACGCGKTWRCMPDSKSKYWAQWHDQTVKKFSAFLNDYVDDEVLFKKRHGGKDDVDH